MCVEKRSRISPAPSYLEQFPLGSLFFLPAVLGYNLQTVKAQSLDVDCAASHWGNRGFELVALDRLFDDLSGNPAKGSVFVNPRCG